MNPSRFPFVWIAATAGIALVAFWAGRGTAPMVSADRVHDPEISTLRNDGSGASRLNARVREGSRDPETRINIRTSGDTTRGPAAGEPVTFQNGHVDPIQAGRILVDTDPIRRLAGLSEILQNVTSENAQALLDVFVENRGRGFEREQEFGLFLEAWARVDGKAAMDWLITKNPNLATMGGGGAGPGMGSFAGGRGGRGGGDWQDRMNAFRVLSGWASADPKSALEWASGMGEAGEENPYLIGVINGLSRTDVPAATSILAEMPYGRVRGMAVDRILDNVIVNGVDASIGWARSISDEQLREGVLVRLSDRISESDPARSLSLLGDIKTPEQRANSVRMLVYAWARNDAAAASSWVGRLDDPELKSDAQAGLIQSWVRRDPDAAGQWLNTQPKGPDLDKAITAYVDRTSMREPQKALLMANSLSDEQMRRTTLERVMSRWMEFDPDGANQFLQK